MLLSTTTTTATTTTTTTKSDSIKCRVAKSRNNKIILHISEKVTHFSFIIDFPNLGWNEYW